MPVIAPIQSILFVCLGNICRSPLAEAAMRDAAVKAGLDLKIDSAGTGDWHIGHPPDRRAKAAALQYGGIDISGYKARQVRRSDFHEFDLICALDSHNLSDLRSMAGANPARISLLLDHLPGWEGQSVADPYYGEDDDFAACWHQVKAASDSIAQQLVKNR
ncbi:MAG: low molecular weight phosphotyrosine protein phosphatase [Sphingomonadales bacterium]|nr:low molecular weight phosphotyrosine protein phosphatase [Sphingomonadales bacterium]